MDVTVKVSIETDDTSDQVSWKVADGVSDLLRSLGSKVGPRGITAKVRPRAAVCHLDERKEDAA